MGTTAASAGRRAFTQRQPIGVVVAVSAFNHPLNLIVHQVATAVAAGCPVLVKPAKTTPLSALRSEEHTSELQSLMRISYAVFCLKKKNKLKFRVQKYCKHKARRIDIK